MPNPNPLLWSLFHGLNHLIGKGLVGVNPEIDLIHVLNFHQTEQFQFITILGYLNGDNKFYYCEKSCRGLQYLSFDTKITLIASVVLDIWFF
jgi:hypothetical protein